MYSVEINLLKDRPGFAREDLSRGTMSASPANKTPLWIGGIVGAAALGLTLLGAAGLTAYTQKLQADNTSLDQQLEQKAPGLKRIEQTKAEEARTTAETQALATIFNQIKPWSAMMQDVRDRVPPGLQVVNIQQAAAPAPAPGAAPAPSPSPSPSPAPGAPPAAAPLPPAGGTLTITGKARSFADINDFVLSLQRSPFLVGADTKLIRSVRDAKDAKDVSLGLVTYEIRTSLSAVPASELLQELRLKGATGLTSRIDFLKQKGVIQK
jgi:type IV pilus assembly protein PilN